MSQYSILDGSTITAGILSAEINAEKTQLVEPISDIKNDELTQRDMVSFISTSVAQGGLVDHNLQGYDDLITHGISQIMTQHFNIDRMMRNDRTQTQGDRSIKSFQVLFQFNDVHLGRPTCTTYMTGQITDLYPGRARLTGLPYSGSITLGASVTVRAFYEDGRVEEKTAEIPAFQIGSFPTMVGGINCHTSNCSRDGLKEMGEDPTDPGGYFIAVRHEYVVDLLENICYNRAHFHSNMKPNEYVRAEFLSQPGGAFENSSQIRVRYMVNGQITIEINSTKFEKVRLPFYLIYRLFGMTDDRTIAETIVFNVEDKGSITIHMMDIIERAFHLADAAFVPLISELNHEKIVQMTAEKVSKYLTNPTAYLNNTSAIQFLNEDLLGSPTKPGGLDKVLLPHMGQTAASRITKLRFLGLIIYKMLLVHLEILPSTDRDSYRNKRVHGAGVSLAKAFKTQVNNSVVTPIVRGLRRDLRNIPWESITDKTLIDTFRNSLTMSDLNRAMEQSITSGNKTVVVRHRAAMNRVSSQALERKNSLNTFSALRTVVTQNSGNASKATERADKMRRVHPTYIGFLCISQSADTGPNVGMRKQLAITAGVNSAGNALPLKYLLLSDVTVTALNLVSSKDLIQFNLSRIFVNGEWIGVCKKSYDLVNKYRILRREGNSVDPHTTIYWDPVTDEVEFWLDVGRLYRPLLIVYSNIIEYDAAMQARHKWITEGGDIKTAPVKVEFIQNIRLTNKHIRDMVNGLISIKDLIKDGIAEYITPEEQENCLLAKSIIDLRKNRHVVTMQYSHCDIEQAIFGLAAHISPFGNHTQPARVTYETNQARQTGGWYVLNFPFRTDKNRFFQFYNEIPLIRTLTHKLVPANGTNVYIAYASYGGDNQEDSAIVCKASADRGLFAGAFFRYDIAELEKGEIFCNPDALTTKNLKPNACYEKLNNGFITMGSIVNYGDVLFGRVAKIVKGKAGASADEHYQFTDRSVVYRLQEPAIVEAVLRPRGANDELFGLIKLRYERPLRTGDKMCLTQDHDVLTTKGWKPIADITKDDFVATMNTDTHVIDYVNPTDIHKFYIKEDIYEVEMPGISLCTTLNHRMYVKLYNANKFDFIEAREIIGCPVAYKKEAINDYPDIDEFVCYGQTVEVIPMTIWLEILGDYIKEYPEDHARTSCYNHTIRSTLESIEIDNGGGKCLPDYVWSLSQKQARILITKISSGASGMICQSLSVEGADNIQRLALHAGWSATSVFISINRKSVYINVNIQEYMYSVVGDRVFAYEGYVHCLTIPNGIFYVRRNGKPSWTGNSSRSGNKSIVSRMLPQSDMPFTENGLTPDIIINTHSFPSRMTIGQLIETNLGKICARKGVIADGTAFLPVDHVEIARDMVENGFRYNGCERMYNGMTGEYFDAAIFIGPTAEQRLQKFVLDDEQSVAGSGPTDATTGQPLGGKHVQGGLRLGEMENWCFESHGSMINLFEKTSTDSDGRKMNVCRNCGSLAVFNEYHNIYQCRCGELADIASVDSSKSAILLHEELAAANINMRLGLHPREFESRVETVDLTNDNDED